MIVNASGVHAGDKPLEPKELFVVPGAGHVDLYDRVDLIPFDKLTTFFRANLKSSAEFFEKQRG